MRHDYLQYKYGSIERHFNNESIQTYQLFPITIEVEMSEVRKDYQTISIQKRLQRQSKIPKEWILPKSYHGATNFMDVPSACGVLSDVECNITSNFDATALLEKVKGGEWSAEQVTIAFCKRATVAHQLVCRLYHIPAMMAAVSSLLLRPIA